MFGCIVGLTVFYQDLPVGVMVTRIEPISSQAPKDIDQAVSNPSTEQNDENEEGYKLYVMTLGGQSLLSSFHGLSPSPPSLPPLSTTTTNRGIPLT